MVIAGALTSQGLAVLTNGYMVSTVIPAFIGAGLHTINMARKDHLSIVDILLVLIAALVVGIWGGPWVAEMAPASERALPIMSFAAAFYSSSILNGAGKYIREWMDRHGK